MKQYVRILVVMVSAQAACLALGLWLEGRFVRSLPGHQTAVNTGTSDSDSDTPAAVLRPEGELNNSSTDSVWQNSASGIRGLAFLWITGLQAAVAYLIITRLHSETARRQTQTTQMSLQRHSDLLRTRDAVIFGLAKLTESRDPETGNHLERISLYSTRLATALRRDPNYRPQITPSFIKLIGISSALHDIGKVGVEDSILLKPGRLQAEERFVMQLHTEIGGRCIREIERRLGPSNFLQMAREIASYHHERWDGTGYPKGLAGEEIPLAARIVAIADVYDALVTERVYKDAFPHEKCVQLIREEAGRQFDPTLVDVFLEIESEFQSVAQRCADTTGPVRSESSPVADDEKTPTGAIAGETDSPSVCIPEIDGSVVEPPAALC